MKSHLELLEDELKKVWKNYRRHGRIKGAHTEIEIEPKTFFGDELNPEIADLLATLYLSKTTIDDVKHGKVEITDQAVVIKDLEKKPIAIIRSQKIVQGMKNKFRY
ncbi:hypothetical protein HZC34_03060 [Candidatus Saganbacteria bacterium]|nr:hypothetical protein [Candidatus Saganbacteria bacterium]